MVYLPSPQDSFPPPSNSTLSFSLSLFRKQTGKQTNKQIRMEQNKETGVIKERVWGKYTPADRHTQNHKNRKLNGMIDNQKASKVKKKHPDKNIPQRTIDFIWS